MSSNDHHHCSICKIPLSEAELLIDDGLDLESVTHDEKLSLFYVAGYVASKCSEFQGSEDDFDTDVTVYLQTLDRGKLTYPSSIFFNFTLLAFLFFTKSPEKFCRTRFVSILKQFPNIFYLDITVKNIPLLALSNIFMKRFCKNHGGKDTGAKRKIAKLSSM